MSKLIDNVLVVGGGTAGWLTAAILAKHLNSKMPDAVQVTLVESADIMPPHEDFIARNCSSK